MSNTAQNLASTRIASLLDENSFVEIGGCVTARNTDFNLKQTATPSDGVITGYGVIDGSLVRVQEKESSQEWYGGNAIYENDPVQLNNLNIDLFGMSDFIDETDLDRIYLFGAGGNRFKTLPVKIDYGEDGVTTYRYEMDGEYISRIDKFQENELTSILEIFYEE